MRPMKWLALALALCLLASMMPAALAEEIETEPEVPLADTVDESTGLTVDDGSTDEAEPEQAEEPQETKEPEMPEAPGASEAGVENAQAPSTSNLVYCKVASDGAVVYPSADDAAEPAALLGAGDVVLATGAFAARTPIAFFAEGSMMAGWMDASELLPMDEAQTGDYLDAAARGEVGLYMDDLDWPLAPLVGVTFDNCLAVLAATNLPNDKVYILNGKEICATMVPETGAGNCWKWARNLYDKIWGCKFDGSFKGQSKTGLNLLGNLNDAQRKLTPSHLRMFLQQTTPGATIRVVGCPSSCGGFEGEGCSKHPIHSLIVAEVTADGVVMMDNAKHHTRYYTWNGFCDSWKKYTYIKYIKWPGAKPLPASSVPEDDTTVAVTGVKLNQTSLTLTPNQTETLTATIEPSNASVKSVVWSSSNASVASVADGVVTAVSPGNATVTVTTVDGGLTATCAVTVNMPAKQKSLKKAGSNGKVSLKLGEQLQLVPTFALKKGWTVKRAKSSKPGVASLSSSGLVTAQAPGTTKITVVTKNRKKATLTIKVVDPSAPTKVKLNRKKTLKLKVGKTYQLKAAAYPTTAVTTFAWASSKPKVASVDENGLITAHKKGTCKIAVRTANGKIAKVKVKVVK